MTPANSLHTLGGLLQDEFCRWDRLGRGETVWDSQVCPEPYFIPFSWHGEFVRRQGLPDEGLRDSLFSSMFRRVREPLPAAPEPDDPFAALEGVAPDHLEDLPEDLAEAVWTVPEGVSWKPGALHPFLYSLGSAGRPLCFEIVATDGRIHLQWAVDPDDSEAISDAVGQLPFDCALEWRQEHLRSLLLEKQLPIVWSRDLALAREFAFPIRTDHPVDPIAGILGAMRDVGDNAVALVQVRFQPCVNPWAESLWRLVTTADGKPFVEDGGSLLDAVRVKCGTPFYATTVRLAVFGDEEDTVEAQARRLARPFARLEGENSFVLADDYERSWEDTVLEIVGRRSRRSGMVLSGDELLALVHPPSSGAGAPGLERLRRKTWPVPKAHSEGFEAALGTCRHGGSPVPCGLTTAERLRHAHVLGASGTGKSTFLLNSILQDLEAGHGVAVLDPHGDLVDAVLDRLPKKRVRDVVLFDPADAEWPVGFNILRAHTDIERNLLASDFVAIFERLSSSWGDQMTAVLGNAAMAFLESEEGGTLLDLKRFLIEKGFRDRFLRTVRDPEVRYFWTHEFPLLRGTTQASLLTRLNGFLRHRLIRNMVAQRGERFDVARMMDDGKVILAPLSQGLIGQENSWLLGSLLVSRIHQAALSRQAVEESRRRPFFVYLDEAHNFLTPSIAAILSGARKYGVGLVLAHQELDQFPSREGGVLGSILTNCHTRAYFRLGDKDADRLEGGFGHFDAHDFRRLRTGEAICRIGSSDSDFSLDCDSAPPVDDHSPARRAAAVRLSRESYAVAREQLERETGREENLSALPAKDPPKRQRHRPVRPASEPELGLPPQKPATLPEEEEMAEPQPQPLPEPPRRPARTPGRGGDRHKYLQQLIKQHGNGLGLRATIEADLPNGGGSVDVLLEGQSLQIAFEIADSSPLEQEVRNIGKAFSAGIQSVVLVSDSREHLDRIEAEAQACGIHTDGAVRFIESAEVGNYFLSLGAALAAYETTSRGYKVKVRHVDISQEEREERLAAIHRAIAEHQRDADQRGKEERSGD